MIDHQNRFDWKRGSDLTGPPVQTPWQHRTPATSYHPQPSSAHPSPARRLCAGSLSRSLLELVSEFQERQSSPEAN